MKFENRYGPTSRLLHKLAFASGGLQVAVADIEDQMFRADIERVAPPRPVFVTALPRSGTTMLLNLLVESHGFASHTYRDMPFLFCPILWQKLTSPFQKGGEHRERAHGDGLTVSPDSPEAFEEMIWRHFWPGHYGPDRIETWPRCDEGEFVDFFVKHMKKIILLRSESGDVAARYVSKNNANISRLSCLPGAIPDAKMIVLVREPLQHAMSLLRQHLSFTDAHQADAFTRQYMEGIGHYDFGRNLRPINFSSWLDRVSPVDAGKLDFWLEYWLAAYRHVEAHLTDEVRLLSYGWLTEQPREALAAIAGFIEMDEPWRLTDQAQKIRQPREHDVDVAKVDRSLIDDARELYGKLELRARD